jgi:NAD-dependent SIR2 family protein deacetylase
MDHSKYFLFDANHPSGCKTCHNQGTLKTYTCYGCHEHSSSEILAKHQEEGIAEIENCVQCHRSSEKRENGEKEHEDEHENEEGDND